MIGRTVIINCGRCGARLRKLRSTSLRVGPEFITCWKCKNVSRTGDFEWANLSPWRRLEVFFTEDIIVLLALCGYSAYVSLTTTNGDDRYLGKCGVIGSAAFLAMLWIARVFAIQKSIRRTSTIRSASFE